MANIVPDSFKTDLLKGTFNFDTAGSGGNTFNIALYTSQAGFSAAGTTAYTTTNEVSSVGTNYAAGGQALTNNGVAISSNVAYIDFADETFSSVTLAATGALIYKDTSNEAVLVLDFGGTKTATNGDFVIQFPTANSTDAIIRLGDA
jgi:hypothetical protein